MTFSHECIVCIVNTGFSDAVMDAAREFGARGGTVIHGRGTASREAERFFGISIQPDKEVVLILVPHDLTDKILHALYRAVGLKTPGQGIAFSLPVDQVVGLSTLSLEKSGEAPAGDGDADKS
ncbi:MAG: P-II family nitrogen regulator [Clostridia bacterium]|nr:P-II family nitrogen regulator [Clostridia bacterium]